MVRNIAALAAFAVSSAGGQGPDLVRVPTYKRGKMRNLPNPKKQAAKAKMHAAQVGKIAACVKCHEWFPTYESRNEHKRAEHGN